MHCEFGHRLWLLEKSFFFLPFESQSTSVNCALQDPTSIGDPLLKELTRKKPKHGHKCIMGGMLHDYI